MAVSFRSFSTGAFTSSSWATSLPSASAQNDCLLLAVVYDVSGGGTITTPSGWTLESGNDDGANGRTRTYLFSKVQGASESAPTLAFSGTGDGLYLMLAYSGADTTDPVDGTVQVGQSGGAATVTGPAITPSVDNCMVVGIFGTRDSANLSATGTPGTGYTERGEQQDSGRNVFLYAEEKLQSTAGQDTPSFTQDTSSSTGYECYSVSVKPLVSGTDDTVVAAVATATAAVVAPPKPRPTAPFSEINVRM